MKSDNGIKTEDLILQAARKVFVKKGFDKTRMQDIAAESGITQSLLHYYFRSKDKLFETVFEQEFTSHLSTMESILNTDLPLPQKIENLVARRLQDSEGYPVLSYFVLSEMARNPERMKDNARRAMPVDKKLYEEIATQVAAGTIAPITPNELMINLLSLVLFPALARPMLQAMMNIDDEEYEEFSKKRSQTLPKFVMRALQPLPDKAV
jgi:TetR/AcrR family transcriptional regulator